MLYCGNCVDIMKEHIQDGSIDLTVTSPPYDNLRDYNGFTFEFESIAQQLYRITNIGGIVVWIVADETKQFCESLTSFRQALYFNSLGFNLLDTMIWVKPNYAPGYPTLRRYTNNFEYMFVFSKGRPKTIHLISDVEKKESSKQRSKYTTSYATKTDNRVKKESTKNDKDTVQRTNVWIMPNGQIRGLNHPAPFPEQLAHDHIVSWSNEGDIVLDPMCGSGTVLVAAHRLNRNYIGIDISQEYVDLSQRRLDEQNKK